MQYVQINFRVDQPTKEALQEFAKHLGLPMSRVIRMLIMQSLREKRVLLFTEHPNDTMYRRIIELTNNEG